VDAVEHNKEQKFYDKFRLLFITGHFKIMSLSRIIISH